MNITEALTQIEANFPEAAKAIRDERNSIIAERDKYKKQLAQILYSVFIKQEEFGSEQADQTAAEYWKTWEEIEQIAKGEK